MIHKEAYQYSPPEQASMRSFGNLLKELRIERGITWQAIPEITGNDHTTILRLERGERIPLLSTITSIAGGYALTTDKTFELLQAAGGPIKFRQSENELFIPLEASNIGEKLGAYLKDGKISQRELSARSGIDHTMISRLIRGERISITAPRGVDLINGIGMSSKAQVMDFIGLEPPFHYKVD